MLQGLSSSDEESDYDDDDNDKERVELEEIEEEIIDEALDTSQFPTIKDISEEIIDAGDSSEQSDSDIEMETVPSPNKSRSSPPTKHQSSSPTFNLKTETVVELSGGGVNYYCMTH